MGPELRLHAELYDAVRLRRLAAVDATGALALPGPVVDSVAVGLARGRLQQRPVLGNRPLNEYATTSPQALRAYLAAEQLARRGLLQPAADSLLRAIALDSTFGLAYYRLWVVTTFGATPPPFWTARNIVLQGLRHAAALPQRQRDLLTALDVQYRGLITEALRQAEELGRRYPDDAEAAYVQGEAYAAAGLPGADSLYGSLGASWRAAADGDTALALAALRAGFATRPEVVEATFGGLRGLIALRRGDTATARAGLRQGLSLAPYDVLTPLRGDLTRKTTLHGRFAVALAQIERADGDLGSALNRLRFTSYATGLVVERAEAEEVRAEIAAQQGDTAVAVRAYRNFIALWKDADPELQARVATARDALTRLAH